MYQDSTLSLEALRRIHDGRFRAISDLETAMGLYWSELGNVEPGRRTEVGRPRLRELLGAYAKTVFKLEVGELVKAKLPPIELREKVNELVASIQRELIPPQFHIKSGFYLEQFRYDEEYHSYIVAVTERCAEPFRKPSPREIIETYCEQNDVSHRDLATRARVDESVIHAIKRGVKKCGAEALARVAHAVGCDSKDLVSREP